MSIPPSTRSGAWPAPSSRPATASTSSRPGTTALEPVEARASGRHGAPSPTQVFKPGVVVVAAATRGAPGPGSHRRLEPEQPAVEGLGVRDGGHVQVNVADPCLTPSVPAPSASASIGPRSAAACPSRARRSPSSNPPGAGRGRSRSRCPPGRGCEAPRSPSGRGSAGERPALPRDPSQRCAEARPVRDEDREVEEPGADPGPGGGVRGYTSSTRTRSPTWPARGSPTLPAPPGRSPARRSRGGQIAGAQPHLAPCR